MNDIDSRRCFKKLAGEMQRGADASRPERQGARLCLCNTNKLGDVCDLQRRTHEKNARRLCYLDNRTKVLIGIIRELVVKQRIYRKYRMRDEKQRIAIWF